jgi:hypothetical protein
MIYLGDRMGLYQALNGAGSVTSEELARKTGLHERWIREWLYGQAAADLIDYKGEDRFELSPERAAQARRRRRQAPSRSEGRGRRMRLRSRIDRDGEGLSAI